MTYTVPTCSVPGCAGHLGKFDSCVAEAVYVATLDDGSDSTGSTDYRGSLSLITFTEDEGVTISDDMRPVIVPAGTYLVGGHSSGAVDVVRYPSETDARRVFDLEDTIYGVWSDEDDEDEERRERTMSRLADELVTVAREAGGVLVTRD